MSRKLIVITIVVGVLTIAGLPSITTALHRLGVIPVAQSIRAEYLTGTAIVVILALLVLLPGWNRVSWRNRIAVRQCPVCEGLLGRPGRYCPSCGSRI